MTISFTTVIVVLLAAEVVLHLLDIPPDTVGHQRLFVEYDSIRGWRNIPGRTDTIVSHEYRHALQYNSRGMRGPVIPYEKPAGTLRVLLLGDSFVDGYTEELGDRVSDVLERELAGGDAAVEVIPMGTGGYSTDQELLWLESEGLRYDPDIVILVFHPNDVWYTRTDRYWRGGKPRFALEDGVPTLKGVPVPRPDTAAPTDLSVPARVNGWIRRNSKVYWLAARAAQNSPRAYGLAVRLGLAAPSPEMVFDEAHTRVTAGEFSVFSSPLPPETVAAWSITRALIVRMRDRVEASGADFMTFVIPIRSRIYTRNADVRTALSADRAEVDLHAVIDQFEAMCAADSIPYIDPTDAYVSVADSLDERGERLYYRYDWHWNANGHRLAGEILADYVRPRLFPTATAAPRHGIRPACSPSERDSS